MSVSPPATLVVGGQFDAPFYPTLPETYTKGHILTATPGDNTHNWVAPFDIELLGVAISCNEYDIEDNWSLIYKGRFLVETVYTKELPEGIHFMTCKYIQAGDTITFTFKNTGASKVVWFNYQCLCDAPVDETQAPEE